VIEFRVSVTDMVLLQAAIVFVVVLILAPGYSFYFDIVPKSAVLLAGTGAILLVAAVPRAERRFRLPKLLPALLLLDLLSLALSTVQSARPDLSLFGAAWRGFGSLAQVAILTFTWLVSRTCAGRPARIRTILRGVTLAGIVSAAYGIAQYAGFDPLLPAAGYHVGEGVWTIVRPPGTLGYASYFATWLLFAAFLGLALYGMEESLWWRRVGAAGTALAIVAMLLTGTRAAVLALLVGAAVWAVVRGFRITRRGAAVVCLLMAAPVAFYYSPPGSQLRSRARWFAEDPWGGARLGLWHDSLYMASHHLPAGYGPEVFTAGFPHFESAALAKSYPDFSHESPHNIFIDALISQGIPGLAILLAICADGFRRAWRLKAAPLAAALAAGVFSQQFTAFTIPTAFILFTTLALLAALDSAPAALPARGGRKVPFAMVAALAGCAFLYFAARLTLADHSLALAQQALRREDLQTAAAQYRQYERRRLPGGSADLWYSRSLLNVALHSKDPLTRTAAILQSEAAAIDATRTAEDPFDSWYNLAVISGLHDDGARAEQCLRAAIAASPNWYKPHWTLAQVLRAEGRIPAARQEAALAEELDAGKHSEVARTFQDIGGSVGDLPSAALQR
jgi:O-antigen ligase